MIIHFIVNGEDIEINTEPNRRLISILRDYTGMLSCKIGCLCGNCGMCSVFYNGKVVPSCMIPAFELPECEIVTLEGFSQTLEYADKVVMPEIPVIDIPTVS